MKFDHSFKLYEKSKTGRTYICDNTVAKLDFISPAAIRVAIYKKGAYMLPTFTINPNNDLSQSGRDKLATDAFEMFEPVAKKTDNGEKFILKNGIEVNLDLHNFLLSYEKNGKVPKVSSVLASPLEVCRSEHGRTVFVGGAPQKYCRGDPLCVLIKKLYLSCDEIR